MDEVLRRLRDRVRHRPAPTTAPPGRLETVAWLLLHRVDPVGPGAIARRWHLPVPPLHGHGPRASAARRTLTTTGATRAAPDRLAALGRACPSPAALTPWNVPNMTAISTAPRLVGPGIVSPLPTATANASADRATAITVRVQSDISRRRSCTAVDAA